MYKHIFLCSCTHLATKKRGSVGVPNHSLTQNYYWGHRGRDRMVVGYITAYQFDSCSRKVYSRKIKDWLARNQNNVS
jgi:hypothetical protein